MRCLYACVPQRNKEIIKKHFERSAFCLEAPPRFELGNKGFAGLCLTTWLWRHITKDAYSVFCVWSGRRDSNSRRSPWQGDALPLSHSRINGASDWNRTSDTRIFSPLLYQLSYRGKFGDPEGARTLDLQRDRLAF